MTQVFISYSRKDLSFVKRLASDLKNAGFDVWYDLSEIRGGTRWRSEIEDGLRKSQYTIVVLSPDSVASEWVEREFLFASQRKLKIIPLYYRSCEIPLDFLDLNYIDVQGDKYQENLGEILNTLNHPPSSPRPVPIDIPSRTLGISKRILAIMAGVFLVIGLVIGYRLLNSDQPPQSPQADTPQIPTSMDMVPPATSADLPPTDSEPFQLSDFLITYHANTNRNRDIFEINPATMEVQDILTSKYHEQNAVWSPDGRMLAFESWHQDNKNYYQIYLYDSSNGKIIPLTEDYDVECSNQGPSWSPDGKKIVFYARCKDKQRDIYIMDRDGSNRKQLTTSPDQDWFPVFSPDGNSITYTAARNGKWQIYIMDLNGKNERFVADGCTSTFSPDGQWLWFSATCEKDSEIMKIRMNRENLSTVGLMTGQNPSLSPDGQFVVFQSGNNIWVMDVDGSNRRQITTDDADNSGPSWRFGNLP